MECLACPECNATAYDNAVFCHNCGNRLKCKSCNSNLVKNAKNCIICGELVVKALDTVRTTAMNTIKFHKNKDEVSYEIALTDEVGKEGITELVANIASNRIGVSRHLEPNSSTPYENITEEIEDLKEEKDSPNTERASNTTTTNKPAADTTSYPHLNDVELTVNCNEAEWIAIYAFYESNFATNTFTKEKVHERYIAKRKTETRSKNFAANWKSLFKHYISTVNETTFKFKIDKLDYLKRLITGNEKGNLKNISKRKATTKVTAKKENSSTESKTGNKKTAAKSIETEEFDAFKSTNKQSLEDFINEKKPGDNTPNRIALIGYYITKIVKLPFFTEGQIDYAYKTLRLTKRPTHLGQTIINLKNKRAWFKKVTEKGKEGWKIERPCEIYVEEKLPPKIK